jgi:hypothetical protein
MKAENLPQAMSDHWKLQNEVAFRYTGKDCLLLCLSNADAEAKANILMLCSRAWHLKNDIVHQDGM